MLNMSDVVVGADFTAPQAFTIQRSTAQFVLGGFESVTSNINMYGPVQAATDKEIRMLPEADQVNAVLAFWSTIPIYVTRGEVPQPSVQGEQPAGAVPGTVYTLSAALDDNIQGTLTKNGALLLPGVDYARAGATITLALPTGAGAVLWYEWPTAVLDGSSASDLLVYASEQYRVLAVRHYPGSGYWKALGTRTSAS